MPVAHVHEVLSHIAPPLQAPSAQSDGANLYTGGPPIINYFSVSPAGPLWPGRQIELHWSVEGADAVEIVARDVAGSPPQELPRLRDHSLGSARRAPPSLYPAAARGEACTCCGPRTAALALPPLKTHCRWRWYCVGASPSGAAPEATSRSARCSTSTTRRDSGLTLSPPPRSDLSTLLVWLWGTTTQQRRPRP
jgi:hypothetical protein